MPLRDLCKTPPFAHWIRDVRAESAEIIHALHERISPNGIDLPAVEKSLYEFYIEAAFEMAKGNESKAAQLLNLNHHTYRYRRKKLLKE